MKAGKLIFLLAGMLLLPTVSHAQDLIVKTDGTIIKAVVQEVGERSVAYKDYDQQDMPNKYVLKLEIQKIVFETGETRFFEQGKDAGTSQNGVQPKIKWDYEQDYLIQKGFRVFNGRGEDVTKNLDQYMSAADAKKLQGLLPVSGIFMGAFVVSGATALTTALVGLITSKTASKATRNTLLIVGCSSAGVFVVSLLMGVITNTKIETIMKEYNQGKGYYASLDFGAAPHGLGLTYSF